MSHAVFPFTLHMYIPCDMLKKLFVYMKFKLNWAFFYQLNLATFPQMQISSQPVSAFTLPKIYPSNYLGTFWRKSAPFLEEEGKRKEESGLTNQILPNPRTRKIKTECAHRWNEGKGNVLLHSYKKFNCFNYPSFQKHCTHIVFFASIKSTFCFLNLHSYINIAFLECKHPHIYDDSL